MRWRLLGSFALIILIALGTVAVVTRYTTQQEVETFLGHGGQVGLENLANSLEDYYAGNGSWVGVESILTSGPGHGQGQRAGANAFAGEHVITDSSGIVIYSPVLNNVGAQLSDTILAQSITLKVSGKLIGYLLPEGGVPTLPDDFEELLIERVNRASLLAALISGGIAILLALILATLILRPVRGLTKAANKMAEGDLSQRVDVHGVGELATLGETFNQMATSLQEAEASRQAMTADIAHELRNPLAIQRAHLEALQDGIYPLTQENLMLISEQNRQLTRLVDDLRTLALVDAGELSLNKRRVDLVEICTETATRFQPQATAKSIHLTAVCGSHLLVMQADKERLQQVIDNLMQNALRYTPVRGWIEIAIQRQGKTAIIAIHNNGPAISVETLEHLFERFYRGDKARDRASGGTGLGLAIARKLAEAHGGTLIGENHPAGGVVFKLVVPLI
jgi:signal transduction histidine kinase